MIGVSVSNSTKPVLCWPPGRQNLATFRYAISRGPYWWEHRPLTRMCQPRVHSPMGMHAAKVDGNTKYRECFDVIITPLIQDKALPIPEEWKRLAESEQTYLMCDFWKGATCLICTALSTLPAWARHIVVCHHMESKKPVRPELANEIGIYCHDGNNKQGTEPRWLYEIVRFLDIPVAPDPTPRKTQWDWLLEA